MIKVKVTVTENKTGVPVAKAEVSILDTPGTAGKLIQTKSTDSSGSCEIEVDILPGNYVIQAKAFAVSGQQNILIEQDKPVPPVAIQLPLDLEVETKNGNGIDVDFFDEGDVVVLEVTTANQAVAIKAYSWSLSAGSLRELPANQRINKVHWDTTGITGIAKATATITDVDGASLSPFGEINVREGSIAQQRRSDGMVVSLRRANIDRTKDQALWVAIHNRAEAISFNRYSDFIDRVLCNDDQGLNTGPLAGKNDARLIRQNKELYNPLHGVGAYELLKTATQAFLLLECGVFIEESSYDPDEEATRLGRSIPIEEIQRMLGAYLGDHRLPYIQTVIDNAFEGFAPRASIFCPGFLAARADCPPLLELIWSYWHEEAMLVQSMNAISLRFQNRRSSADRDPLAYLEIAPLFPVNNLLWGYIQDEQQRLSVPRRAYEYDHQYGLMLAGKAIPDFRPAETRSKFLEAFHHLLYLCTVFYKQADDTTVIADGFPVLNALKEVHLLLAEAASNQFGNLTWTARAEMLMEQWILSRPEMRQFLQSRHMVPYREAWMGQVDTMKRLQGWTDVTVTHFNELAIFGEQILLSARYGNWNLVTNAAQAANWAQSWRPEIQNYIHGYRAVTGVDLRADLSTNQQRELLTTPPTVLIRQRLLSGQSSPALPAHAAAVTPKSFRERQAARRANGR